VHRLERLATRVKLVGMAEQGASFLDLYRHLVERGSPERDAYFDAQRICRGGTVSGGAPFTKDACYLAGLLQVYAFLNVFVRGGFRDETELLVCGRIDLEDIVALVKLRALGVLSRPVHRPRWLRQWDTLLPTVRVLVVHDVDRSVPCGGSLQVRDRSRRGRDAPVGAFAVTVYAASRES
jgi:hypothetical protein